MNEPRSDREWADFYADQQGIYEAFVDKPEQQYPWVRDAVSRPYIKSTGDSLRIILQRMVPSSLMGPEQQQGRILQNDNSRVASAGGKRVQVVLYRGGPAGTHI